MNLCLTLDTETNHHEVRNIPFMTSALEGGRGSSKKADKGTDKLCEWDGGKGGGGKKNLKFLQTSLMKAP